MYISGKTAVKKGGEEIEHSITVSKYDWCQLHVASHWVLINQ